MAYLVSTGLDALPGPTVVILGGGFAGITLIQKLAKQPVKVLLIDQNNFHTCQPLLYQVATGSLAPDNIGFPYRRKIAKIPNVAFRKAVVQSVDTQEQHIHTDQGIFAYDYLVVATGSTYAVMGLRVVPSALPTTGLSDESGADQSTLRGELDEQAEFMTVAGDVIHLPLPGRHNARNLLLAIAVAQELGVPLQKLINLQVEVPGGRNRRLQLGGLTVLDETYNASPEAVMAALTLLAQQPSRRFAVLGTMLELGEQSVDLHRQVAEYAAALQLDGLVVVSEGPEAEAMAAAAAGLTRLSVVSEPVQAAMLLSGWLQRGDVVLLKASRGVALERLIPLLPDC